MEKVKGKLRKYEAMFIVDSAKAGTDLASMVQRVKDILQKNQAEVESLEKWDERKLAYTIRGHKRGTYLLGLFSAPPEKIVDIDRACRLTEEIVRVLILSPEEA